jgi:hypothetical protein
MIRGKTYVAFSGEIPDYRSNFTNWVECVFVEGNLRIKLSHQEGEVMLNFYVPAQYSAGLGTVELHRESFPLAAKTFVSTMSGRPFIVRCDQGVENLLVYCFGRHYFFEVVPSV